MDAKFGFFCAITAHTLWGLFPIFWSQLNHVAAMELVWHRILWSFVILSLVIPFLLRFSNLGGYVVFRDIFFRRRTWEVYGLAAIMIAINWFAFIWAVNNNRVLEASLGYYINPLFNVTLGVVVLGERLKRIQWIAVGIAALGVTVMSLASGGVPWVSLAMASSFAFYALIKKKAGLPGIIGLWFEMAVLFFPALFVIGTKTLHGEGALVDSRWMTTMMLVAGGLVTIAPLLLFASAVRRVPLSIMGILQYIGPTLQFILGAYLFAEPLDRWRVAGFVFVWIGILVFLAGNHVITALSGRPRSSGNLAD